TMYNIRFDSNRPPQTVNATIGFFKTGSPITIQVQGPMPAVQANVSISGRVTTQDGTPIRNAYVFLSDPMGARRLALTNPFGYYSFDNVLTGQTYSMGASSRVYSFPAPVNVPVNDNVTNQDFVALP
ncbi:MAG: carboxypeptidase-like regulatory domain-containing protein, partial [Acidobacteriota bacterium]